MNELNGKYKKIEANVEIRNSLLAALMIAYNILCAVLQQALQRDLPYGNIVGIFIIVLSIIFVLLNRKAVFSFKIIFLCIYILLAMILSWLLTGIKTTEYFVAFVFYGLVGAYIGMQKIDTERVLRYLIYISFLPMIFINGLMDVHFRETSTSMRMDMGISYAILPMVLAAMLHFIYYRNRSGIIIKMGYIVNVVLMILLLIIGTRGGLLSLFIFFLLAYANQYKRYKDSEKHTLRKRRKWIVWLSICAGIMGTVFYDQIMLTASRFFSGHGIYINIFAKTERLIINTGDGTNGRIILWKAAMEGILKSPIWGHGWGSFFRLTGHTHPHNLILELMYQGGLFLAIPILLPVFRGVYKCATGQIKNVDDYAYSILLISSCLPRLIVSASLWNIQMFWIMLSFMMVLLPTKINSRKLIFKEAL